MTEPIIPRDKTPFLCCRVGDPYWKETPGCQVSACEICQFPVHISADTNERLQQTTAAIVVCAECAARHYEQTGRKFAPVSPNEAEKAGGNEWTSELQLVICQLWYESERGWGWRPDGFSLHLTEQDRLAFIRRYWEEMPNETPSEYSKETKEPFNVGVTPEIYERLKASEHGIWSSGSGWPEPNTIIKE